MSTVTYDPSVGRNVYDPEKRNEPPEGYRLLREGEVIRAGDIYMLADRWLPVNHTGGRWNSEGYWPTARKIDGIRTE